MPAPRRPDGFRVARGLLAQLDAYARAGYTGPIQLNMHEGRVGSASMTHTWRRETGGDHEEVAVSEE